MSDADKDNKFVWRKGDLVVQYPADADAAPEPTGEQADRIVAGSGIGTSAEDDEGVSVNQRLTVGPTGEPGRYEPRRGKLTVNWHTGHTKPDDEPLDENRHSIRWYHGSDVSEAINHSGTFNGRDRDKQAALDLIAAVAEQAGPIFETFRTDKYVAVLFADRPETVGAYINTGYIETTVQADEGQFKDDNGYWRCEFAGYGGRGSTTNPTGAATVVPDAECACTPGLKAPVGSECQFCGSNISAEPSSK